MLKLVLEHKNWVLEINDYFILKYIYIKFFMLIKYLYIIKHNEETAHIQIKEVINKTIVSI